MRIPLPLLPLLPLLLGACDSDHELPLPAGAALIEDRALSEMSGLEASPSVADVFWSINDSGSWPRLFRLGADGRALGRVRVDGAWLRDTETLAVWREAASGRDWLLIGDVGDNRGWRREVRVHAVPEPLPGQRSVRIAWSLRVRYPDGPRDVEGIAVDHRRGDLLLLSKRDTPARLYRVPLSAREVATPATAEFLAALPVDAIDGEVTGLDLSKDGRLLAVLSYRGLYLWRRDGDADWAEVLAQPPQALPLPALRKAEAMAFGGRSDALFVGSERLPAPLLRIEFELRAN